MVSDGRKTAGSAPCLPSSLAQKAENKHLLKGIEVGGGGAGLNELTLWPR